MSEVAYVQNDEGDWCGVYLDGQLVYEGHSVDPARLLELVNIPHVVVWDVSIPFDLGRLPALLVDVPGGLERRWPE